MDFINPIPFRSDNDLLLPGMTSNLILIHPSTMKKFKLQKGSPVLITSPRGELLLKSWPYEAIDASSTSLPAYLLFQHYTYGSQFIISLFKESTFLAKRVVFTVAKFKPFMDSTIFKEFMKKILDRMYLREEMVLHLKYLGYPCSLTIKKIANFHIDHEATIEDEQKKQVDLCSSFTPADDSTDDSLLLDSFNDKCFISKAKNEHRFQSSTPVSSPKVPAQYGPLEKSNLNQLLDSPSHTIASNAISRRKKFYSVSEKTTFVFEDSDSSICQHMKTTFKDIGGLDEQLNDIRLSIDSILRLDQDIGSRGILIIGPPGSGKSLILKAVQNEYRHTFSIYNVNKHSTTRSSGGISQLHNIFKQAVNNSPSLVLIDEIDQLCRNENKMDNFQQEQIISEIASTIYKFLNSVSDVLMVATAQSELAVPSSLCKHGLLDKEIKLPIPLAFERKQMLKKILARFKNVLQPNQISEASDLAHGFTGGDLSRLCSKAYYLSLQWRIGNSERKFDEPTIEFRDLKNSLEFIKPTSVADYTFEVPNIKWSDIGGMVEVKNAVKEMVDWPLKYPEKLKKLKVAPPRGILMYGPPGCCKTMIAKALAAESQLNFINIKNSDIFSKYVGDSEKSVSELFIKARSAAPCVLFFDEIDSLAPIRGSSNGNSNVTDRVVTQLLIELDGVDVLQEGVSIIAATNRPDRIDPSLLRPGRLDRLIYVSLPDVHTRREIFKVELQNKPLSSDIDLSYLAEETENYTGAEISDVCREACMCAIREEITTNTSEVNMKHLLTALLSVQPRTTEEMIKVFESYNNKNIF